MRKSAMLLSALLLAGILFSGCSIIPDNTSATSSESTINSILASEIDRVLQDGPELEAMPIDYNPKDHGRIFPNIVEFTEDMWEKEKDSAVYSFITLDGEVVCGPLFDMAAYDKNSDSYIVRRTENGVSKYGFLSSNGAVFTGLIFDGAAAAKNTDDDELCFFGSVFENGKLWVYPVDLDLEILEPEVVTINEQELNLTAKNSQLSVLYMNKTNSVLINRKEFYYSMALGTFNNKTTAVRLIPVPGKTVGDSVEFGGLLGTAPIMDVNRASCADFIHRGGRIPAPIHSMRN